MEQTLNTTLMLCVWLVVPLSLLALMVKLQEIPLDAEFTTLELLLLDLLRLLLTAHTQDQLEELFAEPCVKAIAPSLATPAMELTASTLTALPALMPAMLSQLLEWPLTLLEIPFNAEPITL